MSDVEKIAAAPEPVSTVAASPVKVPVPKIDDAAAKAYAEASAKVAPVKLGAPKGEAAAPAVPAGKPAQGPAATKIIAAPKKTPVASKALKVTKAAAKTVTKAAKKTVTAKPLEVAQPAPVPGQPAIAPATSPIAKLKDTVMETVNNTNVTATAKAAYAKGTEFAGEATEFTKANLEAVVESGKIFFTGAQELLKDNVETGKTVLETVTEDAKKVAAVKSPTELFQLQSEIARRNFDAMVAYGSKRTEAWVKLYNDAFAPISNRVSVAVDKVKNAA